jgi:hypothetical protein
MSVQMQPQQGGTALEAAGGNVVTQHIRCINSTGGTKPLAMRLKVQYQRGGCPVEHLGVVSGFPSGV